MTKNAIICRLPAVDTDTQHTSEPLQYWEIYVPVMDNEGTKWNLDHHFAWDAWVVALAGGLTLTQTVDGRWGPATSVKEEMIPVRVVCTREQMRKVVEYTKKHYQQTAVMAYVVSNEVMIA